MKLIYCPHCYDVRKLSYMLTTCECGKSYGQYSKDGLNAVFGGDAMPLGFANSSLIAALKNQPEEGLGERFEAFVIPKQCPTFKQVIVPKWKSGPKATKAHLRHSDVKKEEDGGLFLPEYNNAPYRDQLDSTKSSTKSSQ